MRTLVHVPVNLKEIDLTGFDDKVVLEFILGIDHQMADYNFTISLIQKLVDSLDDPDFNDDLRHELKHMRKRLK